MRAVELEQEADALERRASNPAEAQTRQSRPKAALRRLPSTPYGQQLASAGTIPVAVTAKVVSVAMMNFT